MPIDGNSMVQVVVTNDTTVCEVYHLDDWFPNVWNNSNPFESNNSLILLQLTIFVLLYRCIHLILQPLGQLQLISQLSAGLILGPAFLRRNMGRVLFPAWGFKVIRTFAAFGVMIYHFTIGVKIDPSMVKRPGRAAFLIGSMTFFLPIICVSAVLMFIFQNIPMPKPLFKAIPYMSWNQPFIGFPTVCCLLSELKILNTNVGRLAISSTVVYEGVMLILTSALKMFEDNKTGKELNRIMATVSSLLLLLMIRYVCQPIVVWLMDKTPQGKPMKESHLVIIFVIVVFSGFVSEMSGQRYIVGPMVLGLLVPDGPPLGTTVENRIETLITTFLYPAFVTLCGMQVDLTSVTLDALPVYAAIVLSSFSSKLVTVVVTALCCNISYREAFILGLVLNAKGIMELVFYTAYKDIGILQDQEFALCVLSVMVVTCIVTPIVKSIYAAPRQYVAVRRFSIQHAKPDGELGILVAIYDQESVPTVINILEASYASEQSPIIVMIMVLVELVGRAAPVLVNNKRRDLNTSASKSERIVKALLHYEELNDEIVRMETFTAINDFSTMHDDICQVALDEAVNIVMVPFHKQWTVDGNVSSVNAKIRTMNINVLQKAPCSVGILIDRGALGNSLPILNSDSYYKVAVLFIGGNDDAECLAYGSRMAKHWKVSVTVIRFIFFGSENTKERKHDSQIVHRYREENLGNDRFTYIEETVKDGAGLAMYLKKLEGFDLIMVGREHPDSPIFIGMEQWSEYPELGVVTDMLASSDCGSTSSVLVIQQHRIGGQRIVIKPSVAKQVDDLLGISHHKRRGLD